MSDEFQVVDLKVRDDSRRKAFEGQTIPPAIGNHTEAAQFFKPDGALVVAVNAALALGAPLLLTGEPGTGKTQVAHWLAYYFGIPKRLFTLTVQSTTTASDLLYRFDTVRYFHAANDPARKGEKLDRTEFRDKGPLWQALEALRSIVLIDEIDKAPRDFPNDLLHMLDQFNFYVRETDEKVERPSAAPPLVVITSNNERRLPEPFLRRCIFHFIRFDEDQVRDIVASRAGDFPRLPDKVRELAVDKFFELRRRELVKKPATAELLVWLTLLSARGGVTEAELHKPMRELPALSALIKSREDLDQL